MEDKGRNGKHEVFTVNVKKKKYADITYYLQPPIEQIRCTYILLE